MDAVSIKKEFATGDGTEQTGAGGMMVIANSIKKEIVDEVEDGNVDEFITRYNTYLSSMQSAKGKVNTSTCNTHNSNIIIFVISENSSTFQKCDLTNIGTIPVFFLVGSRRSESSSWESNAN